MEEVHMIFDKQKSSFMFASNCECRLASAGRLVVKYVDIRMARVHTESERTNCSSAYLTSEPAIELPPKCVDAIDESSNFFHGTVVDSNTHSVVITLMDIYKHGDDDAPEYVWIAVSDYYVFYTTYKPEIVKFHNYVLQVQGRFLYLDIARWHYA
ncbi:hypothetical protein DPMN_046300 [Dreissena polymorpha]|uniref:Uncharacterized protein n=1 Tax=Dreissena polymorpha TaxID=45954 RepID=A0A9D4I250_DREPO|nr:hypothetical protein DPMN_046300 [Dreissena polymorpha]